MRPRPQRLNLRQVRPARAGAPEPRPNVPTGRTIRRLRDSRQIVVAVAAVVLLAGVALPTPVSAQDDVVDFLDAISDLFSDPTTRR